ncbi:C6 finger domain protein [Aspergillus luchuensis]|uniref:C6 finger domain protein n=1 Tax=Aspergillus kawachii TaxID=1069201 RepID=A0A146G1E8_ASPKA|nr:C6 finger domain protein [Aspergillus luchuensis]
MSRGFPGRVSGVDSTRNYLNALKLMRKELSTANISSDRELLASIMCLSLAEMLWHKSFRQMDPSVIKPELPTGTSNQNQCESIRILKCFEDLLNRLNEWEASEFNNATSPLYWYRDQDAEEIPCMWFPSITMANAITYIWAFRIICLCEMERLASSLPQPSFEYLRILKEQHIESVQISSETLMRQICESMEYLLQGEMKLFGPASTILPLQVAYAVATMNGNQHNAQLPTLKRIVERLVLKGLQSFPILIFEKNSFLHRWAR